MITYRNDVSTYLDVHIVTKNTRCIKHEATRNTEFCMCEICFEISCFNQIITDYSFYSFYFKKDCKLCGKLNYQDNVTQFKLCSDCYLISSGWVESTLSKKPIPILYLPWWDPENQ